MHSLQLSQPSLIEQPAENPPLREAIDFYRQAHNWSNRLVAGDSPLVIYCEQAPMEKFRVRATAQVGVSPCEYCWFGTNGQSMGNPQRRRFASCPEGLPVIPRVNAGQSPQWP